MGKEMTRSYVSFQPNGNQFIAFVSLDAVSAGDRDLEVVLRDAAACYGDHIWAMRVLIEEMRENRMRRMPIFARRMWVLGDQVLRLIEHLSLLGLELDGVYDHLSRDLGVKRKWLEKAVIFRRHIPVVDAIPESLKWGKCEKGTRKVAERIMKGEPVN